MDLNKIRKVLELTKRGEGGEKAAAENLLKRLADKFGIDPADLEKEQEVRIELSCRNNYEDRLIIATVRAYFDADKVGYYKDTKARKVFLWMQESEAAAMAEIWAFFSSQFRAQRQALLDRYIVAFVHKYDIFAPNAPKKEIGELDEAAKSEAKKMFDLADQIDKAERLKTIEGPK